MKRVVRFIYSLFMLVVAVQANEVVNSKFLSTDVPLPPNDSIWGIVDNFAWQGFSSEDDGTGSVRIWEDPATYGQGNSYFYQDIIVEQGVNYQLLFDVKGWDYGNAFSYSVLGIDSQGDEVEVLTSSNGHLVVSDQWGEIKKEFSTKVFNTIRIKFSSFSNGAVCFDNIRVLKQGKVYNGGFDSSKNLEFWKQIQSGNYIGWPNNNKVWFYRPDPEIDPKAQEEISISQEIYLERNTEYNLSFIAKSDNDTATYHLCYSIYNDNKELIGSKDIVILANGISGSNNKWNDYSFTFFNPNESNVTIKFEPVPISAHVYIDNVSIHKTGTTENSNLNYLSSWKVEGNYEFVSTVSADNDGSGSLKLWGPSSNSISQRIPVKTDENYVISFKAKAQHNKVAYIGYCIEDKYGNAIKTSTNPIVIPADSNATWKQFSFEFKNTYNYEINVIIFAYYLDFFFVDDIQVKPAETICNSSFNGLSGWNVEGSYEYLPNTSFDYGSGCFKLWTAAGSNTPTILSQKIAVKRNSNYILSWYGLSREAISPIVVSSILDENNAEVIPQTSHIVSGSQWKKYELRFNSGNSDEITLLLKSTFLDFLMVDNFDIKLDKSGIKPVIDGTGQPYYPIGWFIWYQEIATHDTSGNYLNIGTLMEQGFNTFLIPDLGVANEIGHIKFLMDSVMEKGNNMKFVLSLNYEHVLERVKEDDSSTYIWDIYKDLPPEQKVHYIVKDTNDSIIVNRPYVEEEFLGTWINFFKDRKELLGWQLSDEINARPNTIDAINESAKVIKKLDPNHQVWQVMSITDWKTSIPTFMEKTDVCSYDYYANATDIPYPEHAYMSFLKSRIRLSSQNEWAGSINVTQGVGKNMDGPGHTNHIFPTKSQYSWNVFYAMTLGYRGTLNWIWDKTNHLKVISEEEYNHFTNVIVKPVFSTLNFLKPALENGWNVGSVSITHPEVKTLAPKVSSILLEDINAQKYYLILANEIDAPIDFDVAVSDITLPVSSVKNLDIDTQETGNAIPFNATSHLLQFSDAIDGYCVKIYEIAK